MDDLVLLLRSAKNRGIVFSHLLEQGPQDSSMVRPQLHKRGLERSTQRPSPRAHTRRGTTLRFATMQSGLLPAQHDGCRQ